jgi:lipid-binding SYLF domain-containing protein
MTTADKFKLANKGLANRPLNKACQNTSMHLIRWMSIALISCMIFTVTMPQSTQAEDNLQTVIEMMKKNSAHLKSFFSHKQAEAIRNVIGAARAVYFAPEVTKGGFLVGLEKGKGMILRRHGQEWSDPVFLSLSEYSVGTQIGVKESALIMLIMTDDAVDDLAKGLQKMAGSGGFALGNWGMGASGGGGLHGGLEVITVTTAKGAFLGGGLSDMKMSEIKKLNQSAYGAGYEMSAILSKPGGKLKAADSLRAHLKEAVIKSWAQ